ncbi:hypothetical protein M436DRAFT_67980 [Aureobasidium namibiae CBS 147.97]|uniref:Uncharacterized protein n=1 Tax=Aureobasidium namibiae CBS 147.97 TaxID=1043004 RepID=A0A074X234_9PEZI|nr:uncharacterized protein M436DRAFT_67980 [Aureobasidium namibiae CBS 147.97]KEQ68666.1 hypothetical protein M436DRAFT_67980 [Aureobasidium namibiae CBS 147.97]
MCSSIYSKNVRPESCEPHIFTAGQRMVRNPVSSLSSSEGSIKNSGIGLTAGRIQGATMRRGFRALSKDTAPFGDWNAIFRRQNAFYVDETEGHRWVALDGSDLEVLQYDHRERYLELDGIGYGRLWTLPGMTKVKRIVIDDDQLSNAWKDNLRTLSFQIKGMRQALPACPLMRFEREQVAVYVHGMAMVHVSLMPTRY